MFDKFDKKKEKRQIWHSWIDKFDRVDLTNLTNLSNLKINVGKMREKLLHVQLTCSRGSTSQLDPHPTARKCSACPFVCSFFLAFRTLLFLAQRQGVRVKEGGKLFSSWLKISDYDYQRLKCTNEMHVRLKYSTCCRLSAEPCTWSTSSFGKELVFCLGQRGAWRVRRAVHSRTRSLRAGSCVWHDKI